MLFHSSIPARRFALLLATACLLVVIDLIALKSGAVAVSWREFFSLLFQSADADAFQRSIVFQLRMPRLVFAMIVGAALAVSGTAMQALFRNPLAEPGLIGLSAGAALGAVLVLMLGFGSLIITGLAGFLGALLATLIAYILGRKYPGAAGLLLAGIAINASAMSLVSLMITFASDAQLRSFVFWSMGSLTRANWTSVMLLLPWTVFWSTIICLRWRVLNALLLGEREAHHLGFDLKRTRKTMILSVAMLVGPLVAVTGGVAFVGLIVPHMLRMRVGADHRLLLPLSCLVGAITLVLADWLARVVIVPAELPVGVITSLVGGPFFLWLLTRNPRVSQA